MLVEAAFFGLARGGATRQVVAARIAALVRSAALTIDAMEEKEAKDDRSEAPRIQQEVDMHLNHITPVMTAAVAVGAKSQPLHLCGRQRAARNVGTHAHLGVGTAVLEPALADPQAAQRGGRRTTKPLCGQDRSDHSQDAQKQEAEVTDQNADDVARQLTEDLRKFKGELAKAIAERDEQAALVGTLRGELAQVQSEARRQCEKAEQVQRQQ